jgi:hypothetical protein
MPNRLTVVRADGQVQTLRSNDYGPAGEYDSQIIAAAEHVRTYTGVQNLVLSGSVQSLTLPVGTGTTHALIYAEGTSGTPATDFARYWQDGTNPAANVGKKLRDHEEISCASPGTFKAIIGSGAMTLRIEYYKYT